MMQERTIALSPREKAEAQANLASLSKSVRITPPGKPTAMARRDMDLKAQPNYAKPEWAALDASTVNSTASTRLMGTLWVLMTDLYGHKWTTTHGLADESGNWGRALAGVTPEQIAIGAHACSLSGDPWPPSAPEFRAMCTEGKSGLQIPDPLCAWREAVLASSDLINWKFSHPIVQEAGRLTDWISIRTGRPATEQVQARFLKRYAELTTKLARGESLVGGQLAIAAALTRTQAAESDSANDKLVLQRIRDQGLHAKTPEEVRAELFATLGIKRKSVRDLGEQQ